MTTFLEAKLMVKLTNSLRNIKVSKLDLLNMRREQEVFQQLRCSAHFSGETLLTY
jgi:hypothetical protein